MLSLDGQIREVAMAVFLSNLTVTLGAVFWGKLIDAMHWRKTIVAICSAAVAITATSMFFISSIPLLMLMSALVGFFSVGPAPVTNLLVMEKSRREDWLKTYNWTSLISAVGFVVAMLAWYVWLMEYSAQTYAIVCSAIAVSSLVLTVMFVQDPPATLKRRAMVRLPALIYRLKQVPMMFLKPVSDLSVSKLRASVSKKEFLFFAGTGLYFLSGNLMFTPYTPFLKDSGVTDSEVFLAYTILHLSRMFFLPFNHGIVAKTRRRKDEPA
jgi:MFS family permease